MKFQVFATDVLPLPGVPTSGTPLRTHGLAEGLRAHGHEVEVSVPRPALEGMLGKIDVASLEAAARSEIERWKETAFDFTNQASLVDAVRADVVLCGHWPAATFQSRISPALVIDLAGPHLLERHFQGTPDHGGAVLGKLRALSNADYFIVSGGKQRLYFLSFMLRARVEQPERRTVAIHMPLNPELPERREEDVRECPRFVFSGVFLPWQDPSLALERATEVIEARGRGSLTVIGGPHPHYPIEKGVYAEMVTKLATRPFVRTLPMIPYERLIEQLTAADVAIDLMRWNLERELAMTIRSTTYLWSGVPVIYNDYADLGGLIRRYDAGWTVSPSDAAAFDRTLDEVYDDAQAVARKRAQARRLAREVFSWDRAVEPLLEALGQDVRSSVREVDIELARPEDASLDVTQDRPIEQHFLSRIDGLARVECCLATHARDRVRPVTLSLYAVAGGSGGRAGQRRELLAKKRLEGDAIRNNDWVALDLPPVDDSGGRRFALAIESEARTTDESLSPWASLRPPFPMLDLRHGDRRVAHLGLCLRTSSQRQGRDAVGL